MKLKFSNRGSHSSSRYRGGSKIWLSDQKSCFGRNLPWTRPFYWISPMSGGWLWSNGLDRWIHRDQWDIYGEFRGTCSNQYPHLCMNHRKFRRLIKQWSTYLPEGIQFKLYGRLTDFDIVGTTSRSKRFK